MKAFLVAIAVFVLSFSVVAQSLECQLLRDKILREANPPDVCSNNYQLCMRNLPQDPYGFERNRCQMALAGCQIGGGLASSSNQKRLAEMISTYKENCEKQ